MKSMWVGVVACAFALAWTVPDAAAATCTGGTPGSPASCTAEEGELVPGNTPSQFLNDTPLLIKYDNVDETTGTYDPPGGPYADNFVLTIDPGAQTGSFEWVKTDPGELDPTLIAFKTGDSWFFLALNLLAPGTFTFDTAEFIQNAISHISVYDHLGNAIPLPPALVLFGTALVGMGVLGRRRRRQAAQPSPLAA